MTAVIMDVALVATGVATWLENRAAADDIAAARALDLFHAVRRSFRDWRDDHGFDGDRTSLSEAAEKSLREALDDLSDRGLRYVAIIDRRGNVQAEAGKAATPDPNDPPPPPPGVLGEREPHAVRVAERVRFEAPFGGAGFRRGPRMVIEIDTAMSDALAASALQHLVVSIAAAVLLLITALVFWRLGQKADRIEAQLARDRRLAALGEMSAVLGHELRNPLAALKGHAQLVVERLDPEKPASDRARASAERVVHEATRIEVLMRRVLDFARTGTIEPAASDPAALLRAAVDHVAASAPAATISVDVTRAPATAELDRARMEQVLVNLLENAVQAAPDGVVATCEGDGDAVVFSVRDRGPGFPPDEGEAVFEPFRTHRIHGTGLGLAIARRIVEAHRGRIEATNVAAADGGGALVRVRLPLVRRPGMTTTEA